MPAPALIAAAARLWASVTGDAGKGESLGSALSAVFGPEQSLHIALDDHGEAVTEGREQESGPAAIGGDGAGGWIQWDFPALGAVGDARFGPARWRFYRSGLIVFNGVLETESGGLDGGELLGRRIELRTRDGLLLGAWLAGFFVPKRSAVTRFASTTQMEHAALALHFDDLAETQTGLAFRR